MLDDILGFADEYVKISGKERASHPKKSFWEAKIEAAAGAYLNKRKTCSCPDWYLDMLMEIINFKKRIMKTNYQLRQGGVLHIFSRMDLLTSNQNITDDLAELHLGLDDRKLALLERYPTDAAGEWKGISKKRFYELCKAYNVDPKTRVEGCRDFASVENKNDEKGNKGNKGNKPADENKKDDGNKPTDNADDDELLK